MDRSLNNSSTTQSRPATNAKKEQHAQEFADKRRRENLDTITYQRTVVRSEPSRAQSSLETWEMDSGPSASIISRTMTI